jgi:hypothetical protein
MKIETYAPSQHNSNVSYNNLTLKSTVASDAAKTVFLCQWSIIISSLPASTAVLSEAAERLTSPQEDVSDETNKLESVKYVLPTLNRL